MQEKEVNHEAPSLVPDPVRHPRPALAHRTLAPAVVAPLVLALAKVAAAQGEAHSKAGEEGAVRTQAAPSAYDRPAATVDRRAIGEYRPCCPCTPRRSSRVYTHVVSTDWCPRIACNE